jgi:uncharacterized membrane protein YeaQ/YmgE (transglycosylase-associated protein family)
MLYQHNACIVAPLHNPRAISGPFLAAEVIQALLILRETLMNMIVWLIVGGLIGWLASVFMNTDAQQGVLGNVIVGIVGALLGGMILSPILGVGTINQANFSLPSLVVSFLGAIILLALVIRFRRGPVI